MWKTRARITGIIGRNIKASSPKYWIASKKVLELWNINVKCSSYSKYLSIWSKVTLGYALEIWKENINRFHDYDWILYNNKRLKDVDLSEDVMCYKDYGTIYLKIAIKGSGKDGLIGIICADMEFRWSDHLTKNCESNKFSIEHHELLKWEPDKWFNPDKRCRELNREKIYSRWEELMEKNPIVFLLCCESKIKYYGELNKAMKLLERIEIRSREEIRRNFKFEQGEELDYHDHEMFLVMRRSKQIKSLWTLLGKMKLLKISITGRKKNVIVSCKVFNTQEFLGHGSYKDVYGTVLKMKKERKLKKIKLRNDMLGKAKFDARISRAQPFNRSDVYDHCRRVKWKRDSIYTKQL
jgi:hypothetical protein